MRLRPFGTAASSTLIVLGLLSSVAAQDGGWINPDESMPAADMPSTEADEGAAGSDQGTAETDMGSIGTLSNDEATFIPRGQLLPPPGSCRIWLPDRPPGHEQPPGPCDQVAAQVLPGATLVGC